MLSPHDHAVPSAFSAYADAKPALTEVIPVSVPTSVSTVTGAVDVAATGTGGVALTGAGAVWVWGDNTVGQHGNGTLGGVATTPVEVPNLSGVSAIDSGTSTHAIV